MKFNLIIPWGILVLTLLASCHHDADLTVAPPKPPPPGSEFLCSHDTVFFKNSVLPVVISGCAKSGCHGGSKPANNMRPESYDEMVACANTGRLMGALRHESGFSAMPQGGIMPSPCDIGLFQIWINTGKPQKTTKQDI